MAESEMPRRPSLPPSSITSTSIFCFNSQGIRRTPPAGYAGCCHAIAGLNLTERLQAITVPTLIIVGEDDPGTPVAASRTIQEQIPDPALVILPSVAHLSNLEHLEAFNQALLAFLAQHTIR